MVPCGVDLQAKAPGQSMLVISQGGAPILACRPFQFRNNRHGNRAVRTCFFGKRKTQRSFF